MKEFQAWYVDKNNKRLKVAMETDINKKLNFDWLRRFWL